jgi:hypothetical protein
MRFGILRTIRQKMYIVGVGADLCVCPEGECTMGEHIGSPLYDEYVIGENNT